MFLKQVDEILQKEKSTYTIDELLKHFDSSSIVVCLFLAENSIAKLYRQLEEIPKEHHYKIIKEYNRVFKEKVQGTNKKVGLKMRI